MGMERRGFDILSRHKTCQEDIRLKSYIQGSCFLLKWLSLKIGGKTNPRGGEKVHLRQIRFSAWSLK